MINGEKAFASNQNQAQDQSRLQVQVWVPEFLGLRMHENAENKADFQMLAGRCRECLAKGGELLEVVTIEALNIDSHLDFDFIKVRALNQSICT